MNFRIDLILEEEQRSASAISFKFIIKLVAFVVPALIVLLIIWNIIGFLSLRSRVSNAQATWESAEPKMKQVLELRETANKNIAILNELEGWQKTHVNWNEHLYSLQKIFPAELQLSSLTLTHAVQTDPKKGVFRQFVLTLNGFAFGINAEVYVQRLRKAINKTGPFTNVIDEVEIKQFDQDPKNPNNRLFLIECKYQPRFF